ncbi:MAG: hypothetical protein IPJ20_20555 [Flammeovirgaceae bacterium]|nr:hypothetical protein [Flammeovirgaceae bacterium]
MLKTRKEGGFTDAWVRIMKEGYAPPVAEQEQATIEVKQEIVPAPLVEEVRTEVGQDEVVSNKVEVTVDEDKVEATAKGAPPLKDAEVLFYTYNPTNGEPIDGEVEIVDGDVARLIKKVKAHEVETLPNPK